MANGTIHREVARADRVREAQKPDQQARKNAINNLRDLPAYREEMDSHSEVTLGKEGIKAKGPPWLQLVIVLAALAAFVAWLVIRR